MLSTARCRALLGPDCSLTEAQLEQLRQDLYALAQITIEGFRKRPESNDDETSAAPGSASRRAPLTVPSAMSLLPPGDRASIEERSAILEFEAGLDRDRAEKEAVLEWAGRKSRQVTSTRRSGRKQKF